MTQRIVILAFICSLASLALAAPSRDWELDRPKLKRHRSKSQVILIGGDRDAGSAYRYRNGYDKTNGNGARRYEHNAGYGFADEIDNTRPDAERSVWGRKYSTAQSSAWGKSTPRVWRIPARANLPTSVGRQRDWKGDNDEQWSGDRVVVPEPAWVSKKLHSQLAGNRRKYRRRNGWETEYVQRKPLWNDEGRDSLYKREGIAILEEE